MMNLFNKKENNNEIKIPQHLAVIMDGNGRWAKKRAMPRKLGHRAGAENLRKFIRWCADFSIKYVTVYAFSTENWGRPDDEVQSLMKLIVEFFGKYSEELENEGVRLRFLGNINDLPEESLATVKQAEEESKNRERITLNIALSYGSRQEIIRASKLFAEDVLSGKKNLESLTTDDFKHYLYTEDMPDPDLMIRTGGEHRISNFLLWQLSYCELYFSDILWPDFDKDALKAALVEFSERERRFGKVL